MRTTLRRGLVLALVVLGHPTVVSILVGSLLVLAGQIVHFIAAGTLIKDDILTTAGPFRHVRNPFYAGSFVTDLGFCWIARSPLAALIWLPLFYLGVIHPRVQAEEQRLLSLHGDQYRAYLDRVPRYLPSLAPRLPDRGGGFTWTRMIANGEPSRQIHHLAFPLFLYAKLRLVSLQSGNAWTLHGVPALLHDAPGRDALLAGVLLVAAPWFVRQALKLRRWAFAARHGG
jgi:hypothetical protein